MSEDKVGEGEKGVGDGGAWREAGQVRTHDANGFFFSFLLVSWVLLRTNKWLVVTYREPTTVVTLKLKVHNLSLSEYRIVFDSPVNCHF